MVSLDPLEVFESTKYLAYKNYNKDKVVGVKDTSVSVMSDQQGHREHDYIDKFYFPKLKHNDE